MTLLKCDFDRAACPGAAFAARLAFVARCHRVGVAFVRYERTRRGWHVVVGLTTRVSFARVVLLQSLLGSDWKRETFNSRRASAWRHVPPFWRQRANVLYRRHYRRIAA